MATKEFSFDDLNQEMSKFSTFGERLDRSEISTVDHYIHTGNYMLNACLTGSLSKGIPNNRAIALAGPSGTGKTFLLLNIIKQAQDMGYYIVFYDSENAVDRELVERFGIDPSRFRYEPVGTVQEFRTSVTNLTDTLIKQKNAGKEIPKILIALDSAGNLATQKEIDDAASGSEKADMTRAKVLKSIFRIMIHRLAVIKSTFIFTNHIYSCVTGETEIKMFDGKNKTIKDIKIGDIVKTLNGDKEVINKFKYENVRTLEMELENGVVIKCSPEHKFLINEDWTKDASWKKASELNKNDYILNL